LLMVPIRFFELPKGVLVDQGMLDRPKVGYSRGVGLVDREGKTIVGPNMYMEAEFKVVSLDEHKLGYTEYFSANTAWEMISEILYEVTHLMVGILTETIEVYRCAAMETPKRDKCRNLISHKRCPGPRRLYCSSQCKRRTSEHAKRNDIKLYEYYVDEGYV